MEYNSLEYQLWVGFFASIIAAIATLVGEWIIQWYYNKKRFSKAQGIYNGYAIKGDDFRSIEEEPQSKATIFYQGKNRLLIKLTHEQRTWEGLIVLENEHYGTIGWRYTGMNPNEEEFGFKRCIIEPNGDRVLLIDDSPPMYGKEILIRDTDKTC